MRYITIRLTFKVLACKTTLTVYKNLTIDDDDWTNNNQYTQIKHSSTQKLKGQ